MFHPSFMPRNENISIYDVSPLRSSMFPSCLSLICKCVSLLLLVLKHLLSLRLPACLSILPAGR